MNDDNFNEEKDCLNAVNITSNVRAPGEYKYYYCGENNTSSDKSFLSFSPIWYTTKISEEKFLLSTCYTEIYTAFIYYCPVKCLYNIYIYQNKIDYKSENISLKPIQLIHLEPIYKQKDIIISKNDMNGMPIINIDVKIFFGAENYLILNELDRRIILIDFFTGNFITLFSNKEAKTQETLYNVIDTFDEAYYSEGEQRIRTYVFLGIKYQEKKQCYFKYRYLIIERDNIENNFFFLHQIDLDLGVGEPIGIKIAKISKNKQNNETDEKNENSDKNENKDKQWFFILCFLSSKRLFSLVTNYNKLSLYQILRLINQCQITKAESQNSNSKAGTTIIGYYKKDLQKNSISSILKDNIPEQSTKRPFFWSNSVVLSLEKKQVAQSFKIFLNINTRRQCALILFFEMGEVFIFRFNYNDSPEEIQNKITVTESPIQLDKITKDKGLFGPMAKEYTFEEGHYFYKSNTVCALTYKYLIMAIYDKVRIYDLETNQNLLKYTFYKENIHSFMLFDNLGFTFMMTWTKIFKIIFTTRLQIFSEKNIILESKVPIKTYSPNDLNYPIFEYCPEDIWNSYCNNLGIDNVNENKKGRIHINNNNAKKDEIKKKCEICGNDGIYYCSDCQIKYYCCQEHFLYDYNHIHFFECQFVQFFKRKDILQIENREKRYLILYNELIKLCGRILNFIFTRIFVSKDCHNYLYMLLNLITLLDNFGFNLNFSEFCSINLFPTNDKQKPEKVLFFQECIYYYVQLQLLKCTFTSKCKLYNLTDCYLKIIKNDVIPKLTQKMNKRISLRCDKLKKKNLLNNPFFQKFESSLFFDLKKIYYNSEINEFSDMKKIFYSENNDVFDIVENYIMKHLMTLSILIKFKIKLHSSIDVRDLFTDISLLFDYHFRENKNTKNIAPYCYFSLTFYLVEIGLVSPAVRLLKKMVSSFTEKTESKLKALTFYNLGILQYALGEFKIGIHNLEIAYKQSVDFFLSEKFKQKVMISLGLAYLNQPNLFKAYVLIQKVINELKKIKKQKYELKCIEFNVYLNYIIDLFEYSFITKSRIQVKKKKENEHQLIAFVKGGNDKELIVIEQHVNEFLKVVEYIWNLKPQVLQQLQNDNPPKQAINYREEVHHEKNSSFTAEQSHMSTFLMRETGIEKEESQEEYDEDIEVKPTLFDSLTRQQQKEFKELKTAFLKREIALRDSLGAIEKFNINYDPLYSPQFQKIVEKLKSNFLLKEIFYCFQNEKWRDELYNYSPNNVLFGLSKYLKLEKIKNMIAIEKSKCLDIIKTEKKKINDNINIRFDTLKKINIENNVYPDNSILNTNINNYNNSNSNNISVISRYKSETMNYIEFKKKFLEVLKNKEKNNNEALSYFNIKEDYLVNLYKNVYLNNPEHDFIFQNPSLILNYIFIDISDNNENLKKEENDIIMKQKLEEESDLMNSSNLNVSRRLRKISNSDNYTKSEMSKFKNPTNKEKSIKDLNNVYDNNKNNINLIISPILENIQDKNNVTESSSDSVGSIEYTFCYLKFDKKDLQIVSKEIEYYYNKNMEIKKGVINDLNEKMKKEIYEEFRKNMKNKYYSDDKEFALDKRKNSKSLYIIRTKSAKNFEFRLKINKNENKEESVINKTDYNRKINDNNTLEIKKTKDKNKINDDSSLLNKDINKENNNINKKSLNLSQSKDISELNKNDNINNSNNKDNNEDKNMIIDNKNIDINKNDTSNKYSKNTTENDEKNHLNFKNFNFLKKKENTNANRKINQKTRKNILHKNNSVKQFNYKKNIFLNNDNTNKKIIKRKPNNLPNKKASSINQKTYNYFSPEELANFTINNKKNIKKISNNNAKNYGFKNKKEQEEELINGAIEYLKNELNYNQNKKNINNILNSTDISLGEIQKNINNNKNDKKNKKLLVDESTMSYTSISNELNKQNDNKNNYSKESSLKNNNITNSPNQFIKEINRIIDYNKKLIKDGNKERYNSIMRNEPNRKMKKCFSQMNVYEKRMDKTENEKTSYSKNNKTKSNKVFSPIQNQKSIYLINNKSINSKNSSMKSNKNNNINNSNKKFRFVLDKYVVYNKNNKTRNIKNKEKKVKNIPKKEKIQKSNCLDKYDYDKKENSKIITTKKEEENIYSNIENKNDKLDSFFNDGINMKIPKESQNVNKNSNETNEEIIDTLCDDLGQDTNINKLIHLPFQITPKYSYRDNNNNNSSKRNESNNK